MLRFFEENNISLQLSDLTIIEQHESGKSMIELYRHKLLGKVLVINNEIQHIEAWQPLYHELVVHIPVSFIPEIRQVLILGGGSFFAAREVLKYDSVERVVMVDYDGDVISIIKNNYDHVAPIISNKKFTLVAADINDFLKENRIKFDLILNDAVDLLEYGNDMYAKLGSQLTPNGVCSDVVYRHIFEGEKCQRTIIQLQKKYNCAFSLIAIPEYPGIFHLLSMWSTNSTVSQVAKTITNEIQKGWLANKNCPCELFNPSFLNYYLYLPPYLKRWISIN